MSAATHAMSSLSAAFPPSFVAPVAVACAVGVLVSLVMLRFRAVLTFQFQPPVYWTDVADEPLARRVVLWVSALATLMSTTVCTFVFTRRVANESLWTMTTVAEIGSTLYLIKYIQHLAVRPVLVLARMWSQRQLRHLAARNAQHPHIEAPARGHAVVCNRGGGGAAAATAIVGESSIITVQPWELATPPPQTTPRGTRAVLRTMTG